MDSKELTVNQEEGDTFEITLTQEHTPCSYVHRVFDLMNSGLSVEAARRAVSAAPIVMELFCDEAHGLFAVESGPLQFTELYNPFTGQEIPNDNLDGFITPAAKPQPTEGTRLVAVPADQLDTVLNYLWSEEERSWDELRREEGGEEAAGYDPKAIEGHIFHTLHALNERLLLDTPFRSLSATVTRRMLGTLTTPINTRQLEDAEMQQIADMAEQFTKITLRIPPQARLDLNDERVKQVWHKELEAILHAQKFLKTKYNL